MACFLQAASSSFATLGFGLVRASLPAVWSVALLLPWAGKAQSAFATPFLAPQKSSPSEPEARSPSTSGALAGAVGHLVACASPAREAPLPFFSQLDTSN